MTRSELDEAIRAVNWRYTNNLFVLDVERALFLAGMRAAADIADKLARAADSEYQRAHANDDIDLEFSATDKAFACDTVADAIRRAADSLESGGAK